MNFLPSARWEFFACSPPNRSSTRPSCVRRASRLLVTVLAYLMIVAGLFWVTMPYLLREQIHWSTKTAGRWRLLSGLGFVFGAAILVCAFVAY